MDALQARAYDLYCVENAQPGWAMNRFNAPDTGEPTLNAENFADSSQFIPARATEALRESQRYDTEEDDEDLIDLELRR